MIFLAIFEVLFGRLDLCFEMGRTNDIKILSANYMSSFSANFIFGNGTLFFAKKSGIVLVEMADRAGSGSSEFHIEL